MNRDLFHDVAQLLIAITLIVCTFIFLYKLYFSGVTVDPALRESMMQVVGGIMGIIGAIVGFYYGTSLSSARKDAAAARVTELAMFRRPAQPTAPTTPATPPAAETSAAA